MGKFIIVVLLGFLLMPKEWALPKLRGIWEVLSFPVLTKFNSVIYSG